MLLTLKKLKPVQKAEHLIQMTEKSDQIQFFY